MKRPSVNVNKNRYYAFKFLENFEFHVRTQIACDSCQMPDARTDCQNRCPIAKTDARCLIGLPDCLAVSDYG